MKCFYLIFALLIFCISQVLGQLFDPVFPEQSYNANWVKVLQNPLQGGATRPTIREFNPNSSNNAGYTNLCGWIGEDLICNGKVIYTYDTKGEIVHCTVLNSSETDTTYDINIERTANTYTELTFLKSPGRNPAWRPCILSKSIFDSRENDFFHDTNEVSVYDTLDDIFKRITYTEKEYTFSGSILKVEKSFERRYADFTYPNPYDSSFVVDSLVAAMPDGTPIDLIRKGNDYSTRIHYDSLYYWNNTSFSSIKPLRFTKELSNIGLADKTERHTFTYNHLGTRIAYLAENLVNGAYRQTYFSYCTFNSLNNCDTIYEFRESVDTTIQDNRVFNYIYDDNNNITEFTEKHYNFKTHRYFNWYKKEFGDYNNVILPGNTYTKEPSTYPNPFSGELNIELPKSSAYLISDLRGKVHLQGTSGPLNGKTIIETADLSPGMYLLNAGGRTVKVVKE
ncbi:MAG: T9SS type A sorting domain-containing protein [Bacteroidota bacterium]